MNEAPIDIPATRKTIRDARDAAVNIESVRVYGPIHAALDLAGDAVAEVEELRAILAAERGDASGALPGWEWAPATENDLSWYRQHHLRIPSGWWSCVVGERRAVVERDGDVWTFSIKSVQVCPVAQFEAGEGPTARESMRRADATLTGAKP